MHSHSVEKNVLTHILYTSKNDCNTEIVKAVFPERGLGPILFSFGPPVAEASRLAIEMLLFGFVLQAHRDCIVYRYGTQM